MSRDNECAIYHISGGRGSDGNPGDNGGEGVGPIANITSTKMGSSPIITICVLFSGGQPVDEPLKFKDGIFTELANVSQRTTGRKCSVIIRCIRTMHTVPSSDVNSHRSQIFAAIRSIRFQPRYAGPLLNRATLPEELDRTIRTVNDAPHNAGSPDGVAHLLPVAMSRPPVRLGDGEFDRCQGLDATVQAAQKVATYLFEAALLGYVALSPHGELDLFESRRGVDRPKEKLHKVFNPNLSEREVELRHVEIMSAHPGSEIRSHRNFPKEV
ncbi:hypothetical protein C8R47DRAFT_1083433 [Mycena vitilis]|nr:hypothetical protein C8R47DRAFT_1083433 [Mycena vitilis]